MSKSKKNREIKRRQDNRVELVERVSEILPKDGAQEVMPGLFLARLSKPSEARAVYQPAFCFVIQGGKKVMLNEEIFRYDPGHYLLFTVDLPLSFRVEEASEENPYFGFRLNLDPALVASVIMEAGIENKKNNSSVKAIDVSTVDADLFDATIRLIRSLETPDKAKVLVPLIKREIIYRLLIGGQGARLNHLLTSTGDSQIISRAIGYIRDHFDKPLKIEDIARRFGMSISGFHHHFKSVTSMSPLQFQKQLRLQEARHLMISGDLNAAGAGFRVGYENPAHFSREYKKLFGAPPQRDIAKLRVNLEV